MTDTATYAIKNLHRSLKRVVSYTHLPFNVLASTRAYVDALLPWCADPTTGLFDLISLSKDDLIDDAIISAAVPNALFGPLQRLRRKRDELQLEKEAAIIAERFCDAKAILGRQRDIDSLISSLVPSQIRVSPDAVASAIRSLGYTGPLPNIDQDGGEPDDARESPS